MGTDVLCDGADRPLLTDMRGCRCAGEAEAEEKLRGVLGDLLESCRLISLYAAPAMPTISAKIWTLLGRSWPYDANGHNGPSLDEIGAWGALGGGGSLGTPEPLFPRLEADALDATAD